VNTELINSVRPSKAQLLSYSCYFFDFDGVILESANIKTEAFVEIYKDTGKENDVLAYHLANQGVSRFVKFKWIAENLFSREISEDELKSKGEQFTSIVFNKILSAEHVMGIPDVLELLKREGKRIFIASGTPEEELRNIVAQRKLDGYFDGVFGTPLSKAEIIKKVMDAYSFRPEDCLFLGDASTDYEAARATGIAFYARFTDELREYWLANKADFITTDFLGIV
jgi:phosphoglycolate phosphatase-like HAD superfamily hydrolase